MCIRMQDILQWSPENSGLVVVFIRTVIVGFLNLQKIPFEKCALNILKLDI